MNIESKSHVSFGNTHAAELQAVGIGLVMWHQVVVVENSYPEYCGVDAHAQEENSDKAYHLVKRKKIKIKNHNYYMDFWPCYFTKRTYLDANVAVLFFSGLNKHSKQWEDRVGAEEGAFWPHYRHWQETQHHCQKPVEALPEHTLPVPFWKSRQTRKFTWQVLFWK